MKRGTFNLISSVAAFALGVLFLFSDGASITANVIGSSGGNSGFVSIIGVVMILSSMILFDMSRTSADSETLNLERLVRGTKDHEEIYVRSDEEQEVELHRSQHDHSKEQKS